MSSSSLSNMTLRSIYIVRHGYRSDWLPYTVAPLTGIACDPPLAPHGVDQATELGEYLHDQAIPKPQLIFSSPFYRCVETANPAANRLHIPIFLEQGIGEWFKKNRGPIPDPPSLRILSTFFPTLSGDWYDNSDVIADPTGEDEVDIFHRCQAFWKSFIPKVEEQYPEVESIMLVSHAATKIALGMALLGYDNAHQFLKPEHGGDGKNLRIDASTCSLDSYVMDPVKKQWGVNFTGNTEFLTNGGEMGWHFATSKFVAGSKEEIEERKKNSLDPC
ncbi:hypothetical protein DASC09_002560 [Saccharomycopsis crataegensis]|uniref:Uncharacterized protein n=1 Tax=Saccharomycopsis crataegensis TaxID=43959 RepID=A0AAV5QDV8_9ASCO|nr:hypothetical protein DASC09_002560 [Saccharomycopsis crataegensis]